MLGKHTSSEPALHINEINVNNKYEFLKAIGKGSYGEVWLVTPKNKSHSKQYVLKRLDLRQTLNSPSQNDIESAENEAKLLSTLKHPNIVAYTESFRSNDGFLNIVMAYCEGGDLYTRLKEKKTKKESLSEDQIIEWFVQICMALQYIHEKNILHRDLKTQNIFLTKNEIVKVGDLGIARVLESGNDFATTIIGTPYYMSPEIFSQKPYGQKSDIWSLGCCVYEMTTLEHAFNARDMNSLVVKIIREQTPQISKRYTEPLREIIRSMLKKNPEDRPTAKSILQNSYIKKHILRLLEIAQTKCQNQISSKSQPIVSVSPASSPSRPNSSSKSRLSNPNHPPILPSYPVLPASHSRPPSAVDINRPMPNVEPIQSNEPLLSNPRARRRVEAHRSNPLPIKNQDKNFDFLSKLSQNDTLHRFRQNKYPQRSSDDEHDISNDKISQAGQFSGQTPRQLRSSSVEPRPPSQSYDSNQGSNSSARRRRREHKSQSSSTEYSTPNESPIQTARDPHSASQDNIIFENEKKKEGEKDMNDFVLMLTATLQLPKNERTIAGPLHETNRLQQRWQSIREHCLQEISPERLQRVLNILENVSEAQMMQEMINELGDDLYERYSANIFLLKFYEDTLSIHS